MVSGSDTHGTPITVAPTRGHRPGRDRRALPRRFVEGFLRIGISYDLFTHTDTQNHYKVTQNLFLRRRERAYIYRA